MNTFELAVIGDDPGILPLLQALKNRGHGVALAVANSESFAQPLARLFPSARFEAHWESLLDMATGSPLLVCGHDEAAHAALRRMIADGRPVLYWPDVRLGLELAYELTLVIDEAQSPVIPLWPARFTPGIGQLGQLRTDGELGRLQSVQWERTAISPDGTFESSAVDHWLFHDLACLCDLKVPFYRITELPQSTADGRIVQATATLATDGCGDFVWELRPDSAPTRWKMQVRSDRGLLTLSSDDSTGWSCQVDAQGALEPITSGGATDWAAMAESIEQQLAQPLDPTAWNHLTRMHEIVDAGRRSMRRRRSIDLHFETASELSQFKTQMTAVGCGVLMLTLAGLILYLIIAELVELPPSVLIVLRILWITPLVVFLLLQFLVLVARPSASPKTVHDSAEQQPGNKEH